MASTALEVSPLLKSALNRIVAALKAELGSSVKVRRTSNGRLLIEILLLFSVQVMQLPPMITALMVNFGWWVEPMPPSVWSKSV